MDLTEDSTSRYLTAVLVTRFIAFGAIGLRLFARRKSRQTFGWDDWLMVITAILNVGATVIAILAFAIGGAGRHLPYLIETSPNMLPTAARLSYADETFFAPLMTSIKLTILAFYLRLFGVRRELRIVCWVQITLVIIWGLATQCVFMFQCSPIYLSWSVSREGGTCLTYRIIFLSTNTIDVILDFMALITPIPVIWGLQMTSQKRLLVVGILMLGSGACIFSSLRLGFQVNLTFLDWTYDHGISSLWASLQINFGVICACLPVYGPLLPASWTKSDEGVQHTLSDSMKAVAQRFLNVRVRRRGYEEHSYGTEIDLQSANMNSVGTRTYKSDCSPQKNTNTLGGSQSR